MKKNLVKYEDILFVNIFIFYGKFFIIMIEYDKQIIK